MSIDRGINKEDAVPIYNGLLLSRWKECSNVICSNMDEPKDCHNKWSKTEKDKYHTGITYMCNLKKDTNELIYKAEIDS